ncbi:MAG: tRNA lysidine(34) synthetase TilS [Prevotellaceae bacterium]|jgi:tRNA(Ile)-lysidine synthase|nr:tRNA lysidine(34) synthetase TilS [Prevotellaceae bacterium]
MKIKGRELLFRKAFNEKIIIHLGSKSKYLLAVSGGIDSMVMAHLFFVAGFKFPIAHCNFSLRGEESDGDEDFVRRFAEKYGVPFYSTRFDTERYADENNISIQVAARELRYRWFEELRQKYGFDKIATAHNADDNLETFFINLSRGAGLNGLTGIPSNTDSLIRPLLGFSRKDIVEYSIVNNVPYREDSSNRSDKYLRNRLRNQLLPVFDEISPSFREKVAESMIYLDKANQFIETEIDMFLQEYRIIRRNKVFIFLRGVRQFHSKEILLFYILKPYGFRGDVIANICNCIVNNACGKEFFSSTHCLSIDRIYFSILPVDENTLSSSSYSVDKDADISAESFKLHCEVVDKDADYELLYNKNVGEFDLSKLNFPLLLRNFKKGDRFVPFGMKGHKKLSDFFVDIEMSMPEKRQQLVLVSGEDIIWVVGLRIDERFKVSDSTTQVLRVQFDG